MGSHVLKSFPAYFLEQLESGGEYIKVHPDARNV